MLAYYRRKPDVFIEEVIGIKLNYYQILMVRQCLGNAQFSAFVMSRGLGKTWLGVLIIYTYCVLYPNSTAAIISGSFRQSKKCLEEKYKRSLCDMSPFFAEQEKKYVCSIQQAKLELWNGSVIEAVPLGDGSKLRGMRLNIILVDEAFTVPKAIYETVLKPMLVVKHAYRVGKDNTSSSNKVILTSTASHRVNWLYGVYCEWSKKMFQSDASYFTLTLPYTVGVHVGLFDEKIIEDAKNTMEKGEFEREYLGIFTKLNDGAWISYNDIMDCCNSPFFETECSDNFDYIMSIDVARVKGKDNTIMMVWKLVYTKDHIEPYLVYIVSLNGKSFDKQAQEVRDLLARYPRVMRIILDANGLGVGLTDELAKPFYDAEKHKWLPPLINMNDDEAMKMNESLDEKTKGLPIIYGIKPTLQINHMMGYAVKKYTQKKWVHFYSDQTDEHKDITYEEDLLLIETKETVREIMNIETKGVTNGFVQFFTKSDRKDRWSATGMALYLCDLIYEEKSNTGNDDDCLVSIKMR